MNEPFNAIGGQPAPRPAPGALDQLVQGVLGPNEDLVLPLFVPFTPRFNLLPRPKPPSWLLLGGIGLAIAFGLLASATLGLNWAKNRTAMEIELVNRMATERKQAEQRYQDLQRQVEAIEAQKGAFDFVAEGSPRWSLILERLRGLMPAGVRLDRIDGDPYGLLLINGKAESLKAVGHFMLNLRGSGIFYEPHLGMGDRLDEAASALVSFDMQVKVAHGDWLANPEFTSASRSATASMATTP